METPQEWAKENGGQKKMEDSELSTGLQQFVQCIVPRKIGQ